MSENFKLEPGEIQHEPEVDGKLNRLLEGATHAFPGLATVIQYFAAGFETNRIRPEDVALYFQENTVSFGKLDQLSSKLAIILKEELGPVVSNDNPDGDLVFGVCAPPTDQLIILLFAIMKLGGAYVPFDISFPEDRVIRIVSVAKPVLVISDANKITLSKFDPVKFKTKVITMDEIYAQAEALPDLESTLVVPLEGNPNLSERTGIVLFTSGSSGEPKGVRLNHRTILNRLNWQWHQFPFQSDASCCWKTALTFVDSVPEIFGPLLQGKHVVVFPKKIITNTHLFVQKVQDHKITRLTVVPSFLQSILTLMDIMGEKNSNITMFSTIKLWICSGEQLNHELLTQFFKYFPTGTKICNFYGSTEIMGDVTWEAFETVTDVEKKCLGERGAHVPIGQALFNTVVYILGPDLELVSEGQIGEIYIAGYNLATGYVGLGTSDKFIKNPYTRSLGFENLYRTGDFGHIDLMQTGRRALFYDGRIDSQIKVRGHRVDLSEIDETLNELTLVRKGVVLCYHSGQLDQQIIAFVVPQDRNEGTADRINFVLQTKLLPYQMPKVKILEEIPVLVNGKTDRQRLLWEYHEEFLNQKGFNDWNALGIPEEALPTFKAVIETVAKVTGTAVHDIVQDLDDSFYNIGGTSLNSLTVIAELKKQNYFISIHNFVTAKSIRELCQVTKYNPSGKVDYSLEKDVRKKLMPEMLNNQHKEEVIHIIATSFATKGDMETFVGVVYVDFVKLMESLWRNLVDKGFSFVVRRRSDMKIIATCLNFDAYDEPDDFELSPGLNIIFSLLEECEAPVRKELPEGKGKILHSFMMGTHEDLTEAENVFVTEFMEEETVRLGVHGNFEGVFTTNTNILTQQIAQDIQGYTIMRVFQINQYETPDGKRPFALAPDSQKATVCWKKISE